MIEEMAVRPGLGHQLSGIHHVGVTVDDLAKSLEFYVEVLGGRLALSGDGFAGETLHQTLFQRECLDAAERGTAARSLGAASVGDGAEKLDVRLISFGSTLVELLHFRDGRLSRAAPACAAKVSNGTDAALGEAGLDGAWPAGAWADSATASVRIAALTGRVPRSRRAARAAGSRTAHGARRPGRPRRPVPSARGRSRRRGDR